MWRLQCQTVSWCWHGVNMRFCSSDLCSVNHFSVLQLSCDKDILTRLWMHGHVNFVVVCFWLAQIKLCLLVVSMTELWSLLKFLDSHVVLFQCIVCLCVCVLGLGVCIYCEGILLIFSFFFLLARVDSFMGWSDAPFHPKDLSSVIMSLQWKKIKVISLSS